MPPAVPRLKFECPVCRCTFLRREKEIKRPGHGARYCSIRCKGLGMQRRVKLRCVECNSLFERAIAEKNRHGERAWCSWKCWKIWQRDKSTSYPKIGNRHAHRVVMEKSLGRKLGPKDIVHHKNHNKKDFRRHNLELTNRSDHASYHLSFPRKKRKSK